MGSIGNAIMVGWVCRLCSRIKKVVIHLYTARAKQLNLLNKIKLLLPISVDKYDELPKTVCEACIDKLDIQHGLLMRIRKCDDIYMAHINYHGNGNCPIECPLYGRYNSNL